jgi:small multidrug resistance pump
MAYLYLAIAIIAEVVGTTAMKASEGFTKTLPTLVLVLGYWIAFYFLTLCLESMKVGVAYAMWSGLGVVLVTIVAAVLYHEIPDRWAILGMALIVAGVLVLNLMSSTTAH